MIEKNRLVTLVLATALLVPPCVFSQQNNDNPNKVDSQTSSPGTKTDPQSDPSVRADGVKLRNPVKSFLRDEVIMWTSPAKIRMDDASWLFPLGAATTIFIATDADTEKLLPTNPQTIKRAQNLSDAGAVSFGALSGAFFLWGHATHKSHMQETGLLAGTAIAHALVVDTALKEMTQRERPFTGGGRGEFWNNGDSFPSDHSAIAWSVASVFAHEYPGPLTKFFMYGGATAVSVSRVIGQKHFPSDVVVGSTLGWLIGRQVYRLHHDPELPGAEWGTFVRSTGETPRSAESMGSAYVPIESWVYGAFDRLEAMGIVRTAFSPIRPWARTECVRLLNEARDRLDGDSNPEAEELVKALGNEFDGDSRRISSGRNYAIELESVYTRFTGISGPPLTDGYHFGQTIIDDYGRPNREGFNAVTGLSARASAGPFMFYVRGEYRHAPSAPGVPAAAAQAIQQLEGHPISQAPVDARNEFRAIESYVGVNLHNFQMSFGKQSLWWGTGDGSPMLFSNNAEPVTMFRANTISPIRLPWIFKYLGPMQTDFFFGQLAGHDFVNTEFGITGDVLGTPVRPQPFIYGQKVTFKPTPNFTFSASRTAILGGPNFPLTPSRVWHSFVSQNNHFGTSDPGDQRGGADMSYRIPGMRQWLTLYVDAFTEDQPTPFLFPERSAFRSGLFMPQLPRAHRLSIRAEAEVTDIPGRLLFPGFHYFNVRYLNGYTNRGNLLGSTVGRQGVGGQFWARYSVSPRNTVELSYRANHASSDFLQGGRQNDVSGKVNWMLRSDLELSSFVQYERWHFPVLASDRKSDFTTSVQLAWYPKFGVGAP